MVRHLVFRCAQCRSTTSVNVEWSKGAAARVHCASCHAAFDLGAEIDRGRNDREYYDSIRRYAAENRIDLASAYSVVEGIMAPEKARKLPPASPEIPRVPSHPVRMVALLSALLCAVVFLNGYLKTSWNPRSPSASTLERPGSPLGRAPSAETSPPGPAEGTPIFYQVDARSRLVKVSSSDLRAVLSAFCSKEFQTRDLAPHALAPADPGEPLVRIGILRNRGGAEGLRSVRIWLDPQSGRWTIGTGTGPVATEAIASVPEGAEEVL